LPLFCRIEIGHLPRVQDAVDVVQHHFELDLGLLDDQDRLGLLQSSSVEHLFDILEPVIDLV
jgi:hypothetical protein